MVPVPIRDWGEAITTSTAQALSLFLAAVPRIIGFFVIVAIGWFIATLIAGKVEWNPTAGPVGAASAHRRQILELVVA